MSVQTVQFRSRAEREREVLLVRNYREIGIGAIAAAARAMRRSAPEADNDATARTAPMIAAE